VPGGECEYKAGELASKVKRASDPSFEPLKKSDTVDQMLASPFRFDKELSSDDFEKLGRLSLRWSHIDHMMANCLKVLLARPERGSGKDHDLSADFGIATSKNRRAYET
jgi:hypothetical protein